MNKGNTLAVNTHIRTFYSTGFSSLMMYFFNTNLALSFAPYTGKNNNGLDQYATRNTMRTTVNYDGAAFLYQTAMPIVNGTQPENQVKAELQCNNNTTLTLTYKCDQDNQMLAYLTITKNDEAISFRFNTRTYMVKENGQMVTKVIQSGLGAFAMTVEAYLTGVGADRHLSKLPDELDVSHAENSQTSAIAGNSSYTTI